MSLLNPAYNVLVKQTQSASVTATTNVYDGIDTLGYSAALITFKFGTTSGTSGTAVISVSESSDNSTYTAVSGATSTAFTLDGGASTNKVCAIPLNLIGRKRYLRVIATLAGTTPATGVLSVVAVLANPVVSVPFTTSNYDQVVTLV